MQRWSTRYSANKRSWFGSGLTDRRQACGAVVGPPAVGRRVGQVRTTSLGTARAGCHAVRGRSRSSGCTPPACRADSSTVPNPPAHRDGPDLAGHGLREQPPRTPTAALRLPGGPRSCSTNGRSSPDRHHLGGQDAHHRHQQGQGDPRVGIVRASEAASFPTKPDGSVDEDKIPDSKKAGEMSDLAAGKSAPPRPWTLPQATTSRSATSSRR